MITKDTTLKEFRAFLKPMADAAFGGDAVCSAAFQYIDSLDQNETMEVITTNYLNDPNVTSSFGMWCMALIPHLLDDTLKSLFIKKINNGEAAKLLLERTPGLSQEIKDQLNIMAYGRIP